MAQPVTFPANKVLIQIGDGADPEVFSHRCMINTTRGVVFTAGVNEFVVPDCDNPNDPAWVELVKSSLSMTVSGEGTTDATSLQFFLDFWKSPDTKNARIVLGDQVAGAQVLTATLLCTEFTPANGDAYDLAQASVSMRSSGPVTWAAQA